MRSREISPPPTGGDFSSPIISSVKPPFSRTNLHIHQFCPENQPFSGRTSVFSPRAEEQVAAADSRRRHWLPKREGAHEVGRTASGYCRCNINISHPCNIRKTSHFPDESSAFSYRAAEQVAAADSRRRHWLPKREGTHKVGRTAGGYLLLQHSS